MAKKKIAIVCTGAVGGYAGAHMVQAGEDVTFIDFWPEHVEQMKKRRADDHPSPRCRAVHRAGARAARHRSAAALSKEKPIDIAFVCTKSYDTAWATTMIKQYLAPDGYCVSLQNCMNEETIAGVVGWGKTLGSIASSITVELHAPGQIAPRRRQVGSQPHRVPRRRGAWPHHRPRQGGLRPARQRRQRLGHREPLGRALVEAGHQRDGQRALGLHRDDQPRHGQERRDPAFLEPARQRGDPGRPGARLYLRRGQPHGPGD